MAAVSLTPEQKQALAQGQPVRMTDLESQLECVLIASHVYDQSREASESDLPHVRGKASVDFEQSRRAFHQELPELLSHSELSGHWVLYQAGRRLATAGSERELIEECRGRGLNLDDCYLGKIAAYMLPEPEGEDEIDPSFFEFEEISEPPAHLPA